MKAKTITGVAMAALLGFGSIGFCGMAGSVDAAHAVAYAQGDGGAPALQATSIGDDLTVQAANSTKPAKPASKQLKSFKKASADFSLELFGRCVAAKGKNANVTVAPMSVMTALSIAGNGAAGKTSAQMRQVLADGASISQINRNLSWYNSRLTNKKKAKLNSANAIWYDSNSGMKVRKKFLSAAKKYYKALVKPADFNDTATVDDINSWVAKQTNNMIKRVVDQLDKTDRLVIVNALYFDAEWANPYEKHAVHDATFHAANGKKRTVQMMYGTERTYVEGKNVTGFVKPYAAGYSYVALLPKEGMSLKSFVRTLDGTRFRKLMSSATTATVHTALPKYSISYTNENMQSQLAQMGMPLAFSPNGANFTKMATDAGGNLYLGRVIHKTKIDLDEQGTKAAAVTAAVAKANAAYDPDAKSVRLDRPLVYAIVDNTTKLPVFVGTVNDIGK